MSLSWDMLNKVGLAAGVNFGPPFSNGLLGPFGGLKIYENPALVEDEEYEETVQLTFRQRWIDPLLHPVTLPFEPWVKERKEMRIRLVASRKIFQTPQGLIMHPVMAVEVRRQLGNYTEDKEPPFRARFGA